jgi:guanine nucleotide-binding protein G(o) subunit alpha
MFDLSLQLLFFCDCCPICDNAALLTLLWYHLSRTITLHQSKTMKQVWIKRAAINVIDSHIDYLNDIPRIASPSYKPTTHDILITRVRTTHVVKEKYRIDGKVFEVYDVGGQRSERKKWFPCFDQVSAVIFVASLSDYDQNLVEAKRTNRMIESLELFRSVCNNRSFVNSSIILFLNKRDIFAEKILYSDIAAQPSFSDYEGPKGDFDRGVAYFIQKFKNCLYEEFNDSFIHVTCATDTNNMQFVLDVTKSIILTGVSSCLDHVVLLFLLPLIFVLHRTWKNLDSWQKARI